MAKLLMPFRNPTTYSGHSGTDYGVPTGTPVRSSQPGVIVESRWFNKRSGYMRALRHDTGVIEKAYHLKDLGGPAIGSYVPAGTPWAYVGNTGSITTGPHLHHEIWLGDWLRSGDAYWLYVDRGKYVGQGSTSGGGAVPLPTPQPEIETEEEEMAIKFGHRKTNGDEWMIVHPDLRGEQDHERGYLVTTSRERATAWGRLYGKGSNDYDFDVIRADYIEIQDAAREVYEATHRINPSSE